MIMGMKKLLSLPPNLVDCFHAVEHVSTEEWFCTSIGRRPLRIRGRNDLVVGSLPAKRGSGLYRRKSGWDRRSVSCCMPEAKPPFARICAIRENIDSDPCVSLGKRQRLSQNLLSLQLPLYERIMKRRRNRFIP